MYIHRIAAIAYILTLNIYGQYFTNKTSSQLLHDIEKLQQTARVLYVAAHPDDENTRMITWLANSQKVTVAYLSLTRGEGGQNLIGPELGDGLGIIRTYELLKAREIDGGLQFFSRARDFGYSKSTEETLRLWNEDSVLKDVVLIIRKFKPDVIINRFPADSRAGHGHHSASAHLALKAYDLAANPEYEPEMAATYGAWQPTRIFWNTSVWWIKDLDTTQAGNGNLIKIDAADYYPYLGAETGELAAYSRSQHKSQGFGIPASRGSVSEYLILEKGALAYKDIFENIKTGYDRWGCPSLDRQARSIALTFNHDKPNLSIYKLNEFKKAARQCVPQPYLADLENRIDDLIWQCSGIYAEAIASKSRFTVGDSIALNLRIFNRIGEMVFVKSVQTADTLLVVNRLIQPRHAMTIPVAHRAPDEPTQPFWLRNPAENLYLSDENQIGNTVNDPEGIYLTMDLEGAEVVRKIPVIFRYNDRVKGEIIEHIQIFPEMTASVESHVQYKIFDSIVEIPFSIEMHSNVDSTYVEVQGHELIEFRQSRFEINSDTKAHQRLMGYIRENGKETIQFYLSKNEDKIPLLQYQHIQYEHIGKHIFFYPVEVRVVGLQNARVKPLKIGYIAGSGDGIASVLRQSGFSVTEIQPEQIDETLLKPFDVVICGIRSYNTSTALAAAHDKLLQYVQNGGTYIIMYQTNGVDLKIRDLGPYPFSIGRGRVTDESARPTVLIPNHKLLTFPYQITDEDLTNWFQEIGLYFAENIDSRYETPIAWADPDEQAQPGGLLCANFGKGKFIYTGLSFFRQLPSGNPGAFKLFINLMHLNQ